MERSTDILAIDPGLDGALLRMDLKGEIVEKWFMPVIEAIKGTKKKPKKVRSIDSAELNRIIKENSDVKVCYLEQSQSRPGEGSVSSFKYGRGFGNLEMGLLAHNIPAVFVWPQTWTKVMHKGMDKSLEAKKRSLLVLNRLYPSIDLIDRRKSDRGRKQHEGLMDALLIAEFARREVYGQSM